MTVNAKFVSCEGTEGAGKSLTAQVVCDFFDKFQIPFRRTREPGGTPLAEELRGLLLSKRDEYVHPTSELLMMFAARSQHINELILPSLKDNISIFTERYVDSTVAYQGWARGLSLDHINTLSEMVVGDLKPDLTIILDIDPEIGLNRARGRGELDRIETETIEFFERARQGYLHQANADPKRYAVIDASQSIDAVKRDVFSALYKLYRPDLEKNKSLNYDEPSM